MKSTFFPHFTIGTDAYDAIPGICREYGKTAVIVGGNKSRAAAEPLIRKACEGTIEITGSFLYGDDATFENAEALTKIPEIQKADMIFAVGGGRAVDTSKWASHLLKKPLFTFPTLASNCASVTAVCIMYNPDHSFRGSIYRDRNAYHTFINTEIIARLIYQLPTTLCEMYLKEVFKAGSIESLDQETLFTIQKFFENNLNVSETSRKLFVHRNTLVYRLEKIKKITGLDLREFDDAIVFKVALMVNKYLESSPVKY